jgi:hypothetical protein
MRRFILIPLILMISGTAFSQADGLSLTTKITEQKYCGGIYSDMAMLRTSLQLTYSNDSSQSLILYKGSDLISYVLVASNSQQIHNKQYETNIHVG